MLGALSMDERERTALLRERRRRRRRRQVRRRRAVALGALLALAAGIAVGARSVSGGAHPESVDQKETAKAAGPRFAPLPRELRGVHVTMSLASLPGKLRQYVALPGLNTIELDVKDEDGALPSWRPACPSRAAPARRPPTTTPSAPPASSTRAATT
jgi:hypothetical protein